MCFRVPARLVLPAPLDTARNFNGCLENTMKKLITALILITALTAQAQIPIANGDSLSHWQASFWHSDSVGTTKVTAGDTVTLSWLQPLFTSTTPQPAAIVPDDSLMAAFIMIDADESVYTLPEPDMASVEYVKTVVLHPGNYCVAVKNYSVGGYSAGYSNIVYFNVVGYLMLPVEFKLIVR